MASPLGGPAKPGIANMPAQAPSPMMVRKIGFRHLVASVESLILMRENTGKMARSFENSRVVKGW
jgi:hypothetical protein